MSEEKCQPCETRACHRCEGCKRCQQKTELPTAFEAFNLFFAPYGILWQVLKALRIKKTQTLIWNHSPEARAKLARMLRQAVELQSFGIVEEEENAD